MVLDETTKGGARAAARLRTERVAWLTTVTSDGQPQSSPVWFLWDGAASLWMLSQDGTPRMRNLEANPKVALHFDHAGLAGHVVVMEGHAEIITRRTPAADVPTAYVEKYADKLAQYEWTVESMVSDYPVTVRIELTCVRSW